MTEIIDIPTHGLNRKVDVDKVLNKIYENYGYKNGGTDYTEINEIKTFLGRMFIRIDFDLRHKSFAIYRRFLPNNILDINDVQFKKDNEYIKNVVPKYFSIYDDVSNSGKWNRYFNDVYDLLDYVNEFLSNLRYLENPINRCAVLETSDSFDNRINMSSKWLSCENDIPIIKENHTSITLSVYVMYNGNITTAKFKKQKTKDDGLNYVSIMFEPIWICTDNQHDDYGREIKPSFWLSIPDIKKYTPRK